VTESPDEGAEHSGPVGEHPTAELESVAAGDPRVRDAVRRLDELSDLPPAEHVEVYESVHRSLQESLAEAAQQADEPPAEPNAPS
jgi:hypothetical protein